MVPDIYPKKFQKMRMCIFVNHCIKAHFLKSLMLLALARKPLELQKPLFVSTFFKVSVGKEILIWRKKSDNFSQYSDFLSKS